ncbi:23S rRNA (uracil(1939)-C(5))-methyltransferase RlmD [Pseudoalteromonas xiamenensis]|uniref:23S rRNA (Uracil(1939)-C(5))-methyltransferase RlmD n=1 Tax=Pseudoalteromonas xiamenensis TaxID=882626 RepID=A0A975DFU0_9GAMM|nr:23S rRNA (uracil(1939)-C(5))-methyltransferase RlmD [Pseudoalteromonas xiamenensis]QTH70998.1 23S rRNA (uracil(1939)-C(5))-methyltransferase RlmD [Pseudoalteromonas xiamenensis]
MAQFFRASKKAATQKVMTLTVTGCDHQGRGVARQDGKVWFIDGALKSETVKAEAYQNKSKFVEAKTVKVLDASQQRVQPFCADFERCGGCQLQHQHIDGQVADKQEAVAALFSKFCRLTELPWQTPILSDAQHYRRSARLACFHDKDSDTLQVGFREKGSKRIVPIHYCHVLTEPFADLASKIRDALNKHAQLKSVSHVQLSDADNGRFVLLRHLKTISVELKAQFEQQMGNDNWHFIWQGPKDELSELTYPLPEYRLEKLGLAFQYKLDNFVQVNAKVNEAMIEQALSWLNLSSNDLVLDLFSGIGNFSLAAAKCANEVIGVEGVQSSVAMATQNAHTNSVANAEFHCADLTQNLANAPWFKSNANVLILDPSRVGAEEILKQLPLKQFDRVLYVSCDPVTLARDSAVILAAKFELTRVGLMNMFPHTGHIESMALFQRR